nr:MBL fold metallo-hydrolase [Luteithermobacter gelatinilyticus]
MTGSCTLIETDTLRFLVDCGMFQGGREQDARNRAAFPFEADKIDFVLLTHAHIDHSGLLPKLWQDGFRGPIYTTQATANLLNIMLRDSAHIQESEMERARRHAKGRRRPPPPLYRMADAEGVLAQIHPQAYDEPFRPHPDLHIRLRDAGHILGSAILEIWLSENGCERKLVFSGDLGQPGRPILRDPCRIKDADYLFMESTYGDRRHKDLAATLEEFVTVVNETLNDKGGNVIIPAFAVGRTQEILYYFHHLTRQGRFRNLNIFVDSPMATAVTGVTRHHMELFDKEARKLAAWHGKGCGVPLLKFVGSAEESRALNNIRSGAVIIAASGMCTAGRIKHHLLHNLDRPENAVLITGFQAKGTLGRRLVDGAEQVRIFGQQVPVRARIHTLGGFSAHADQAALMDWLGAFTRPPARSFVMHGEPEAVAALAGRMQTDLGWRVDLPEPGESFLEETISEKAG